MPNKYNADAVVKVGKIFPHIDKEHWGKFSEMVQRFLKSRGINKPYGEINIILVPLNLSLGKGLPETIVFDEEKQKYEWMAAIVDKFTKKPVCYVILESRFNPEKDIEGLAFEERTGPTSPEFHY